MWQLTRMGASLTCWERFYIRISTKSGYEKETFSIIFGASISYVLHEILHDRRPSLNKNIKYRSEFYTITGEPMTSANHYINIQLAKFI